VPKGFRDMQRELAERNQISPELQNMHEIFGDPNCEQLHDMKMVLVVN
jgi:hypothetical protein